jgi:hypothetical protein
MAANYDITIEQGATFAFSITVTGVNLSGYAAAMQGRTTHSATTTAFALTSTPAAGLTITPGTNSVIAVALTATQTAALAAPSEGVYDLEYSIGGVVTRILEGTYRVTPEVTR